MTIQTIRLHQTLISPLYTLQAKTLWSTHSATRCHHGVSALRERLRCPVSFTVVSRAAAGRRLVGNSSTCQASCSSGCVLWSPNLGAVGGSCGVAHRRIIGAAGRRVGTPLRPCWDCGGTVPMPSMSAGTVQRLVPSASGGSQDREPDAEKRLAALEGTGRRRRASSVGASSNVSMQANW